MKLDKDNIIAFAFTLVIHVLAFILLYFWILSTSLPLDDGGAPINFEEYVATAVITQTIASPNVTQVNPTQPPRPQPNPTPPRTTTRPAAQPITQEKEPTVSIPTGPSDSMALLAEEKAQREREEAERLRKEEEQRRKQEEALEKLAASSFGGGNPDGNRQGDASPSISNTDNPFNAANASTNTDSGGFGSFNLSGRTIGAGGLPRPAYTEQEQGRIVINITVDPAGNVILADIGRGTNIVNSSLRVEAIAAAKKAKFNRITSSNNQSGTITYNYQFNR